MALKDMAYTKAEAKEEAAEGCCAPSQAGDGPKYPWCLELYLNDEVLKKLGMTGTPPVGQELMLSAKVVVTGVTMRQRQGGEAENCVDLQITAMDLMQSMTADERSTKAASKLYG